MLQATRDLERKRWNPAIVGSPIVRSGRRSVAEHGRTRSPATNVQHQPERARLLTSIRSSEIRMVLQFVYPALVLQMGVRRRRRCCSRLHQRSESIVRTADEPANPGGEGPGRSGEHPADV